MSYGLDEECGHSWETENSRGAHCCIKKQGHESDVTDDDHECCCGENTWETP